MNNKISYALTETVINLTARTVTVTDPYTNGGSPTTRVEDLAVEVANAADPNDRVEVELYKGDRSVTATLAPDGRLRALEYNSVGVGTKVVSSVGKVVAFVGSIAAAIASRAGGLPAGQDGGGDVRTQETTTPEDATPEDTTPEDDWQEEREAEHALLTDYLKIHTDGSKKLADLRAEMVLATTPAEMRALRSRADAVEGVVQQARDEVARLMQLKAAWRESKRTTVSVDLRTVVRFNDIRKRTAADLSEPGVDNLNGRAAELWRDFGILLEQRSGSWSQAAPEAQATSEETGTPQAQDFPSLGDGNHVIWRVPRELELWVWKKGADEMPVLVSRETIQVCDEDSEQREFYLSTKVFGEHGGSLTFNDDGQPGALSHERESAWGAIADALGALPENIAGGATKAKEAAEAVSFLRDMGAERARAAAERDLEIAKNKLELAGVHAKEEDYAELQRATQAVELQKQKAALAPSAADPVAKLKGELERVAVERELQAEKRALDADLELAEMRSELAAMKLELEKAKLDAQLRAQKEKLQGVADGRPEAGKRE